MIASIKYGVQWLTLLCAGVSVLPVWLFTGFALALAGSRPLLDERGTFDSDGTPARYQVFSLRFPSVPSPGALTTFTRRFRLDRLPALASGLRGWLSPGAVARLWQPMEWSGLGR